jgi:xylulokinase
VTQVWIGLDLGTSGLKAIALRPDGTVAARSRRAYPTSRPEPEAAEQDPADWVVAARAVLGELADTADPRQWRGIGLSGMIPALVTLAADGSPNGTAITWQDGRADRIGEQMRERCGADALYRRTGQWVDGRYLLPMFLRLAASDPTRAAATTMLASAKDYLFGWLTGEVATDPSTATGYGCYGLEPGGWDAGVRAAAAGLSEELREAPTAGHSASHRQGTAAGERGRAEQPGPAPLPALPPVWPSSACRPLRGEIAAAFGCGPVAVCLGAADSVLGALGLGVREPGQAACIAGTSNVIIGVTDRPVPDREHRFLVTPLAEPGRWGLEMDLLATGSAISWLAGLLGGDLDEAGLVALAARADPADAPIVLPYLAPGEQGALWDPGLRGVFAGLELRHGREDLARGLITGIVLESRRCLAVLEESGHVDGEIRLAGGSAASQPFRTDLADATGRAIVGADADCSARGAAMIAAHALCGEWLPVAGTSAATEPVPERAPLWDRLWDRHERTRRATSR